ncbi:hypothetical protein BBAD15_g10933 [Beauveria bassiana D1-5]|uniref:Uncharacterized protein n=1 Tax=Beauveria bassiana D1-5 TaxID=1245745 RepID=A0A0A2VSQ6_BEABA|nr:hypothetical protein BBAD15_g10933 [Beauveria bassiana D1-5]
MASPCRTKVAEQLLELGAKLGIAGLAGAAIKDVSDKMTPDELEHFGMLEMLGNDEITRKYFGLLQDKYGSENASNPNAAKDLTDAQKVEFGGTGSGTPGGWGPQDEENARNNGAISQQSKVNFDAAKDRYPKQYDQYNKLPDKNLEKAISKHEKQIAEHQGYLNDPAKRLEHVPDWENLSPQHQENLLHHWQQDVNRHESYKAIAEGILKGRNNGI